MMDDKPPQILIIDDEPDIVAVLSERLTHEGYAVEGRTDPVEGRRAAMQIHPDLIILDIQIPGWNGLELIQSLTHLPQLLGVPILIYTGDKNPQVQSQSLELGAAGIFYKTADDQALIQKIRKLLPLSRGDRP